MSGSLSGGASPGGPSGADADEAGPEPDMVASAMDHASMGRAGDASPEDAGDSEESGGESGGVDEDNDADDADNGSVADSQHSDDVVDDANDDDDDDAEAQAAQPQALEEHTEAVRPGPRANYWELLFYTYVEDSGGTRSVLQLCLAAEGVLLTQLLFLSTVTIINVTILLIANEESANWFFVSCQLSCSQFKLQPETLSSKTDSTRRPAGHCCMHTGLHRVRGDEF